MRTIIVAIMFVFVALFMGYAIRAYLNQPTVVMSWGDQKCIAVKLVTGEDGSCYHMPKKYHVEWRY